MRVAHRQSVEKNSFGSAKDRRVRTDSQCQGRYGDGRKQRIAHQLPRPEAHIPPEGSKRKETPRLSMALSYQRGITKLTARCKRGLFRRHALAKVLLHEQLQMRPPLLFKLAILF